MNFNEVIDRTGTYCTQWDYVEDRFGRSDLLPFTISDTDFKLPEEILLKLHERINHGVFGYSRWNHEEFKSTVIDWYDSQFQTKIQSEWITYSPSVIYSISQLINLVSDKNDGIIIQTPAYDAFYKTIRANNRKIIENPLLFDGNNYKIDFDLLEKQLKQSENRILLFCSPHNPTGRVWKIEELERIVRMCEENNVFIISDEIHMDILREGKIHKPLTNFNDNNIAVLTSGTKSFNFPSLLFSYLLIPNPNLRDKFLQNLKEKDGLSSPSVLGMIATMTAYKECKNWLHEMNNYIDENINYTQDFLIQNCNKLQLIDPESTYLLWIDCHRLNVSMEEFQDVLINQAKVAIMDGKTYGKTGESFLRLNVGCAREKLEDGLNRLKMAYDIINQQ